MSKKKNKKNLLKTLVLFTIKPFLPYLALVIFILGAFSLVSDAIFINQTQSDTSLMSKIETGIKNICTKIADKLNKNNNYKNGQKTKEHSIDISSREIDKEIQWSHLYSLATFHNLIENREIDEQLLNEIAKDFESTFKYEDSKIITETTVLDEFGNETKNITEQPVNILVESDTIMGHYKYNYVEQTVESGKTKITQKVFKNEELIGEEYERLKKYLKEKLNVSEDNMDIDVQIILQAASGYYSGKENIAWLQDNNISNSIIKSGKGLIAKRNVYMASSRIYTNNFSLWYENSSYNRCI